jgi:hypothetical protein
MEIAKLNPLSLGNTSSLPTICRHHGIPAKHKQNDIFGVVGVTC